MFLGELGQACWEGGINCIISEKGTQYSVVYTQYVILVRYNKSSLKRAGTEKKAKAIGKVYQPLRGSKSLFQKALRRYRSYPSSGNRTPWLRAITPIRLVIDAHH